MAIVKLGTRGSPLALAQANDVITRLRSVAPHLDVRIQVIRTEGDERSASGASLQGKALFTQRIEDALERGDLDLAVHSLKDLPLTSSPCLIVAAVPQRVDPRDCLIADGGRTLTELPPGATVATSSLRRSAQLRALRPDFQLVPVRGNVDTRINKLRTNGWDGVVLAVAGLSRIGLEAHIAERIRPDVLVPAPGQGALAVQARRDDAALFRDVRRIEDPVSRACVEAERSLVLQLGGDCESPIGALATAYDGWLTLTGLVVRPDGGQSVRGTETVPLQEPIEAARGLARTLLRQDALALLEAQTA